LVFKYRLPRAPTNFKNKIFKMVFHPRLVGTFEPVARVSRLGELSPIGQ
jgi:hypothetical protein